MTVQRFNSEKCTAGPPLSKGLVPHNLDSPPFEELEQIVGWNGTMLHTSDLTQQNTTGTMIWCRVTAKVLLIK